ncbi:MAG: hypothetical protein ACMUIA_04350 [bacterium]
MVIVLRAPVHLETNTLEHRYMLRLAWLFQIHYTPHHLGEDLGWGDLRLSLLGHSWRRSLEWPGPKRSGKGKKTGSTRGVRLARFLLREREHIPMILVSLKKSWLELRRFSRHNLEVGLCTPDFMINALLSQWLEGMEMYMPLRDITKHEKRKLFSKQKKGIKIEVNYREENWLIFIFASHLWIVMWVFLKFIFSRPVLRLGCSVIKSRVRAIFR